ncbi:MAG: mandelate racemase/muconate lactonizing enzyme family protein [Bacteroidales bacterium]
MNHTKLNGRRDFFRKAAMVGLVPVLPFSYGTSLPAGTMKITGAHTYRIDQGYDRILIIKITSDAGISGYGECSPNNTWMLETLFHTSVKQRLMGKDPFNIEAIWEEIYWENHDLGSGGALTYLLAGIDLALWDLLGKALNVPVYKLLGGKHRDRIPVYAGFGIKGGRVPVEEAVASAVKLAERGFRTLKLRVQIRENNMDPNPDPTLLYARAIRKALPNDVEFFVDPNEGYTAQRAINVGRILKEELGMTYFEAPCAEENHRDTRAVTEALDLIILAGEKTYNRWMLLDLINEGNPDVVNPDIIKSGGITEMNKMAIIAQVYHKSMAPHNTKPTLGTAAAVHLCCSITNFGPFIEFIDTDLMPTITGLFENKVEFSEGMLHLPEGPGLGLVIKEQLLEKIAVKQ